MKRMPVVSIATVEKVTIGRTYLVPTVTYDLGYGPIDWPVIWPKHRDVEDFNFDIDHYHYDLRFFQQRHFHYRYGLTTAKRVFQAYSSPLQDISQTQPMSGAAPLPEPVWQPMVCRRRAPVNRLADVDTGAHQNPFRLLSRKFEGHQAITGPAGWICPHRRAPLNGQPVVDGVVTCPLHGLRINHATGVCLGPIKDELWPSTAAQAEENDNV